MVETGHHAQPRFPIATQSKGLFTDAYCAVSMIASFSRERVRRTLAAVPMNWKSEAYAMTHFWNPSSSFGTGALDLNQIAWSGLLSLALGSLVVRKEYGFEGYAERISMEESRRSSMVLSRYLRSFSDMVGSAEMSC